MSSLRDVGKAIQDIDRTLKNIVPITEHIIDKTQRNTSGWGFQTMLTTPIDSYCLVEMGDWQLRKHMFLSWAEKQITLDMIGDSITGVSNKISDEVYKYYHSYNQGNNYVEEYQRDAKFTTTREGYNDDNIQNYGNHNELYGRSVNVYPDEDNTGHTKFTEEKKWDFYEANHNKNSIIHKTKELFNCRKINTIISRFHTDPTNLDLYDGTDARTEYGLSHGRNLLTYDAERNGVSYDKNGYDNPYCRVWTHHHQYSELRARLMRPFTVEDEYGDIAYKTNSQFHKWDGFPDMEYIVKTQQQVNIDDASTVVGLTSGNYNMVKTKIVEKKDKWGWKDSGSDGWEKSVLNKYTGLVNIAPKFLGGAEQNIHTKDCMFSIENLAWQGYDPYSFEKALSWEQRGPFGGRIMWFPPYGLRFSEETSANWNEHTFIGRGESVFTYANTARTGTLEFMMVVDHPSILDYTTWYGESQPDKLPKDTDVLRFFAGCDGGAPNSPNFDPNNPNRNFVSNSDGSLSSFVKPTPLTDEYLKKENTEAIPVTENQKPERPKTTPESTNNEPADDEEIKLTFYVFYPNNYSGYYDNQPNSKVNPIAYLLCGKGAQWNCKNGDFTQAEVLPIDFQNLANSEFIGDGYEMLNSKSDKNKQDEKHNYIIGTTPNWQSYKSSKYIPDKTKKWYYRIDGEYKVATGSEMYKNTFDQKLVYDKSYLDSKTLGLNYNIEAVRKQFTEEKDNENLYSLAEIACALKKDDNAGQQKIIEKCGSLDNERINKLIELFDTSNNSIYKVIEINGIGFSNSHGNNPSNKINKQRNDFLAEQRCKTVISWFKQFYGNGSMTIESGSEISEASVKVNPEDTKNESGDSAKKWRSAKITIKIRKTAIKEPKDMSQNDDLKFLSIEEYNELDEELKAKCTPVEYAYNGSGPYKATITKSEYDEYCSSEETDFPCSEYSVSQYSIKKEDLPQEKQLEDAEEKFQRFNGFQEVEIDTATNTQLYINTNETDISKKERRWYYDEKTKEMKLWNAEIERTRRSSYNWKSQFGNDFNQTEEKNTLRYDQEYHFFKQLEARDPDVFDSLVKKLQYFDPAFHSMTPEGFMGRLNFLHQCTRQGDTISATDENGHSANNLAFGRPPFCILRLGDFYYQKIVIKNISINYDPLVLDLNNEGIGVVPLIANITISFNFIGGGDLSGPVRRLQNAMSMNYYANGRLYDNRADRVEREKVQWDTMGAMGHDKVDFDKSYFHHVPLAK